MPSIIHIVEIVVLLFAGYQLGWFAGFLAHWLGTHRAVTVVAPAVVTEQLAGIEPAVAASLAVPPTAPAESVSALEPAIAAALAETAAAETAERVAAELAAMSAPPKPGVLPQDFLQGLESALHSETEAPPLAAQPPADAVLSDEVTPPVFVPVLAGSLPLSPQRPFAAPEPKPAVPLPGFAELLAQSLPQPAAISVEPLLWAEQPADIDPAIVMASVMRDEPDEPITIEGVAVVEGMPPLDIIVPTVASLPPFEIRPLEESMKVVASPMVVDALPQRRREPKPIAGAVDELPKPPSTLPFPSLSPAPESATSPSSTSIAAASISAPPTDGPAPSQRSRLDLQPASRPGELWSKRDSEQNTAPAIASTQTATIAAPGQPPRRVPPVDKVEEDAAARAVEGGWNDRKPVRVPIKDLPEGVDR